MKSAMSIGQSGLFPSFTPKERAEYGCANLAEYNRVVELINIHTEKGMT